MCVRHTVEAQSEKISSSQRSVVRKGLMKEVEKRFGKLANVGQAISKREGISDREQWEQRPEVVFT